MLIPALVIEQGIHGNFKVCIDVWDHRVLCVIDIVCVVLVRGSVMIDLRDYINVGQHITGKTPVQLDFHTFATVHTIWEVVAVYPHWCEVRSTKKELITSRGSLDKFFEMKPGHRASFSTGDLVMSGIIDPFVQNPVAAVRRD